ncbi:MAG: CPBP family intramembrane metalloprotease [Amaricoccus sp.]|uniref:CPBP family intramembrane glutamic endopeptidase n=1 Tax=Amaricoccus sp. TaxID=1872485 RepID=UPI0039E43AC4
MRFRFQRPAGTLGRALLVFTGWIAITIAAAPRLDPGATLAELVTHGLARQVALAAAFALAAAWAFRWPDAGLGAPRWRALRLLWLPAIYVLLMLGIARLGTLPAPAVLGFLAVNTLLVGLSEETMFRCILLSGLRGRIGLRPAVAISTVAFGVVHVLNVFLTGDLVLAVAQSLAAMASGVLLAAIRLRSGSLWPAVGYHAVWDFATFLAFLAHAPGMEAAGDGGADMPLWAPVLPILFILPLGLYGVFLLRNAR